MWNDRKSLTLSKCCIIFFMLALLYIAFAAPSLVTVWLVHISYGREGLFYLTIYSGCTVALALLTLLYLLLRRIGAGCVFVRENTACLRHISWCCFFGALISAASAFYYFPWLAIAVAAAFMGLIVRVVKNVFEKAVSLQDDAEFTI